MKNEKLNSKFLIVAIFGILLGISFSMPFTIENVHGTHVTKIYGTLWQLSTDNNTLQPNSKAYNVAIGYDENTTTSYKLDVNGSLLINDGDFRILDSDGVKILEFIGSGDDIGCYVYSESEFSQKLSILDKIKIIFGGSQTYLTSDISKKIFEVAFPQLGIMNFNITESSFNTPIDTIMSLSNNSINLNRNIFINGSHGSIITINDSDVFGVGQYYPVIDMSGSDYSGGVLSPYLYILDVNRLINSALYLVDKMWYDSVSPDNKYGAMEFDSDNDALYIHTNDGSDVVIQSGVLGNDVISLQLGETHYLDIDSTNGVQIGDLQIKDLTVNKDNVANKGINLEGRTGAVSPLDRGGFMNWFHSTTSKGFLFVNSNGQLVWDTTAQASTTDTGNAWVDFDDGSASFSSVSVGNGWSGTYTVNEGVVTVTNGIITDVDWD